MRTIIKNRPKTTEEVLEEQIQPIIGPKQKNRNDNRGYDISVKGDTEKDISISLEDITAAIIYYFNEVIKPSVIEDDNRIDVPVMYASPERWKSAQRDGHIRDKEGRVLFPLILIKRETIEKRRDLGNKLDGNSNHLYQYCESRYTSKNKYDSFNVLNNRIPVKEVRTVVIPDYYNMTYSCTIYANYMEDIDRMMESITYASDSYWGDKSKFYFMTYVDSVPTTNEINQGEDRIISSTFTLRLNGYVIPESVNKDMASTKKFLTKAQIIFNTEIIEGSVTTNELTNINFKSDKVTNPTTFLGGGPTVNITNINNYISTGSGVADLNYLNVNNHATASVITPTQALFSNYYIVQPGVPSSLPTTSINNFTFYINGQYIGNEYINSIQNLGNNVVVNINTGSLGYFMESDDNIDLIGKISESIAI